MREIAKSILIVDSERLLVDLFVCSVPGELMQVMAARNCDEARSIIGRIRIDLLLINPTLSGAAQLIDEAKNYSRVPVVIGLIDSGAEEQQTAMLGIDAVRKSDGMSEVVRVLRLKLGLPAGPSDRKSV